MLNIGRHYKISSDIRKIDNGKRFVRTFGNFALPNGVNICSVNLDRETTCLTLFSLPPPPTFNLSHRTLVPLKPPPHHLLGHELTLHEVVEVDAAVLDAPVRTVRLHAVAVAGLELVTLGAGGVRHHTAEDVRERVTEQRRPRPQLQSVRRSEMGM